MITFKVLQYISNDLSKPYTHITSHIKRIHISKQNAYGYFVCGGEVDNVMRLEWIWSLYDAYIIIYQQWYILVNLETGDIHKYSFLNNLCLEYIIWDINNRFNWLRYELRNIVKNQSHVQIYFNTHLPTLIATSN